jgi:hypothetical protein
MATRFYLPATGTAGASPTASTLWLRNLAGAVHRPMPTAKSNTALADHSALQGGTTSGGTRWRSYVSETLDSNQTITGTFSLVVSGREGVSQEDAHLAYVLRVMEGDTSTERGVLASSLTSATEFALSAQTRIVNAVSVSSVSAQAGDRIVLEVGIWGVTPANTNNVTLRFGDPTGTADFALTSGLTTDLVPWAELSQTVTFGSAGAASLTVTAATAPAAGEAVTLDAASILTVTAAASPAAGGTVALAGAGRLPVTEASAPAAADGAFTAAATLAVTPAGAPAAADVALTAATTAALTVPSVLAVLTPGNSRSQTTDPLSQTDTSDPATVSGNHADDAWRFDADDRVVFDDVSTEIGLSPVTGSVSFRFRYENNGDFPVLVSLGLNTVGASQVTIYFNGGLGTAVEFYNAGFSFQGMIFLAHDPNIGDWSFVHVWWDGLAIGGSVNNGTPDVDTRTNTGLATFGGDGLHIGSGEGVDQEVTVGPVLLADGPLSADALTALYGRTEAWTLEMGGATAGAAATGSLTGAAVLAVTPATAPAAADGDLPTLSTRRVLLSWAQIEVPAVPADGSGALPVTPAEAPAAADATLTAGAVLTAGTATAPAAADGALGGGASLVVAPATAPAAGGDVTFDAAAALTVTSAAATADADATLDADAGASLDVTPATASAEASVALTSAARLTVTPATAPAAGGTVVLGASGQMTVTPAAAPAASFGAFVAAAALVVVAAPASADGGVVSLGAGAAGVLSVAPADAPAQASAALLGAALFAVIAAPASAASDGAFTAAARLAIDPAGAPAAAFGDLFSGISAGALIGYVRILPALSAVQGIRPAASGAVSVVPALSGVVEIDP